MSKFPKYFPHLDPLRAIAALAVFFFHRFTVMANPEASLRETGLYEWIVPFIRPGHLGVNFFFVLSGFLITWLMIREIEKTSTFSIKNFLARRTIRIWPLYFLIVLIGFALPEIYGLNNPHQAGYFLTFTSNFDEIINGANSNLNYFTALWSISVEEQFYIGWAIVIGLFVFKSLRTYLGFFAIVILAAIAFRYLHLGEERTLYYHTLAVISDMAIGGGLAAIIRFKFDWIKPMIDLPRYAILGGYLVGLIYIAGRGKLIGYLPEIYVFDRVFSGLFWAFIIFEQSFCTNSLYKLGRLSWLGYLGRISYGLYMYHLVVMFVLYRWWESAGLFDTEWSDIGAFTILSLLLTIACAHVSYTYFEKPILKLKDRFRST